ncbi:MAG: hypothetical protein QMD17_04485 [Rhodocyclaceae bacterium]|nr:hypothetical protein [Rhodocyclaceae bacterium]
MGFFHLPPAIEPDLADLEWQGFLGKQPDQALDVVSIDMTQHNQFKHLVAKRHAIDPLLDELEGADGTAIDQDAIHLVTYSIFDPEAVAMPRGQQIDAKEG